MPARVTTYVKEVFTVVNTCGEEAFAILWQPLEAALALSAALSPVHRTARLCLATVSSGVA
jgi:hypothetical protein